MSAMTDHIPVLETERLRLRAPKMDDLPALTEFYTTKRSHMVGGPKDAREVHQAMLSTIGSWALNGFGFWHVADIDTDAMLGVVGIIFAPTWDEPELGWSLSAQVEGKGIAFEAACAARDYAARHLDQDGLVSYINPENPRSEALARRMGAMIESDCVFLGRKLNLWRHPKVAA